jgi:hypothetical protein
VLIDARASDHVVVLGDDVFVDGSGPLLVSHDRGKTFVPWTAGQNLCVRDFVAAHGTIYAVAPICSETDLQTNADHLYRSIDDGASFTDLGETNAMLRGIDPRDPRIVYADGPCGQDDCVTEDGGASWRTLALPGKDHALSVFDGVLYVRAGAEIDRSDDRGAHFLAVVTDPNVDFWLSAVLADGTLLGVDGSACAIERSVHGGAFTQPLHPASCEPGMDVSGNGTDACAVLADDVVVASHDGGATWLTVATPAHKKLRYRCTIAWDRVLVSGEEGLLSAPVPW